MLEWLAKTPYAIWVSESWGWPLALTFHALGTAMVVGVIFIIGLRLFGLFQTIPLTAVNKLLTLVWIGVVCQVVSGLTLWVTKPAQYLGDAMFDIKFSLVVIGVIATWYFQRTIKREGVAWETAGPVSLRIRKVAATTCVVWAAVTIGGRLTAYLGTLYPA